MAKKKKKVIKPAKKKAVTKKAVGKKSVAAKPAAVQVSLAPKEMALLTAINHNLEVLACMILKQQPGGADDTLLQPEPDSLEPAPEAPSEAPQVPVLE